MDNCASVKCGCAMIKASMFLLLLSCSSKNTFSGGLYMAANKVDSGMIDGKFCLLVDVSILNKSKKNIELTESSCSYYESFEVSGAGGGLLKWYCDANYPLFFSIKPGQGIFYRVVLAADSEAAFGNAFSFGYMPAGRKGRSKKWTHWDLIWSDSIRFPSEIRSDILKDGEIPPKFGNIP